MQKAVLFLSIALIVTPDIALAQQQHQQHDRPATRPVTRPAPARPNPPQPPRPQPPKPTPPRPGTGGPAIQPPRPGTGGPAIQPPRPGKPQPPRPGRPQPPKPQPPRPVKPLPPHRPGAGRPPHFKPIHRPGFQYPHGYRYRRWTIGLLLPSLFLSSRYYYNDYAYLGIGAPPYGYRWVRYGPDLLLVRPRDRRIMDVIYGAFY